MALSSSEKVTKPNIGPTDKDTLKDYKVEVTQGGLSPSPGCDNSNVPTHFLPVFGLQEGEAVCE